MLRFAYDPKADAIYIWLRDVPSAFGENLDHARRVDYAADRQPIGVELLNASKGVDLDDLPEQAAVEKLLEEHRIQVYAWTGSGALVTIRGNLVACG